MSSFYRKYFKSTFLFVFGLLCSVFSHAVCAQPESSFPVKSRFFAPLVMAVATTVSLPVLTQAAPVAQQKNSLEGRKWLEGRHENSFRASDFCAETVTESNSQGQTISHCTLTSWEANNLVNGREQNSGVSCFPPSTLVYKSEDGLVAMKDLKAGDLVLDGSEKPTEVIGFLHLNAGDETTQMVDFYDLENQPILSVSAKHLLYDVAGRTHFAKDFEVGSLFQRNQSELIQVGVKTVRCIWEDEKGTLMAPLTDSGSLLVGEHRIKASCFAEINAPRLAYWYTKMKHFLRPYDGEVDLVDHSLLALVI